MNRRAQQDIARKLKVLNYAKVAIKPAATVMLVDDKPDLKVLMKHIS